MHVERAQRLPALHDELAGLARVVSRFRWRLGLERVLVFGLHGGIATAVAVIGLSLVTWLMPDAGGAIGNRAWLVLAPPVAALAFALVRWPSPRQAALAADRRLALDERLGTALELAERSRPSGRFDHLQVQDAVLVASYARGGWLLLDRRARHEALLAAALLVLAGASLVLLPGLPRPSSVSPDQAAPLLDGAASDLAARAVPTDVADLPLSASSSQAAQAIPHDSLASDTDLAAKVQQEQAERDALDKLSYALGRVSAAQPAADAIQRGDFSAAQQQLSSLGDEADQLSDAAKQQLSKALQAAATNTAASDRQLADRERQAAQALSRSTYVEQRQALRNLADQVQRSGQRSVSADQLARDQGQLQQQAGAQGQAQRAGQSPPSATVSASQSSGAASRSSASSSKTQASSSAADAAQAGDQAPGAGGAQGQGQGGQQGGPGIGTGSDSQPLGDQPSRLDTAGQSVVVPSKLGSGPGARPADGTEDQTGADPAASGKSVAELAQAQQTGQVAPEQNLVPGEQRPVVRGYFR